jgi:hypothetical protein
MRFNVLQASRVKLQLPDRRAIIEDEFLTSFLSKARVAAYRFLQKQERHALPFRNWKEAKELGVLLPEAACFTPGTLRHWMTAPTLYLAIRNIGFCPAAMMSFSSQRMCPMSTRSKAL